MRIDSDLVTEYCSIIPYKVGYLKEMNFPYSDKFDAYGRVKICTLKEVSDHIVQNEVLNKQASFSFIEAFLIYCANERIRKVQGLTVREWAINRYLFCPENYRKNTITCELLDGKIVEIKLSRFLSGIHAVWEKLLPTYSALKDKLKTLRKEGKTLNDSLLRELLEDKRYFETGNYFIAFDNLLNSYHGTELWLSINPLDKLTSGGGEDCGINPTGFGTCLSLNMYEHEGAIYASSYGSYSNAEALLALGSSKLSGLLYVPNGRKVRVPNTDFHLLGYKERSSVWFDRGGLFVERMYPCKSCGRRNDINKALLSCGIPVVKDWDGKTCMVRFSEELEERVVENYNCAVECANRLYLDRVAIEGRFLYRFPNPRIDYSDLDSVDGAPWESMIPVL